MLKEVIPAEAMLLLFLLRGLKITAISVLLKYSRIPSLERACLIFRKEESIDQEPQIRDLASSSYRSCVLPADAFPMRELLSI